MIASPAIPVSAPLGSMPRATNNNTAVAQPARNDSEEALAVTRAIGAGDRAAMSEFYEEWFDRALSLAMRFTGRDEAFCLDVAQEAMLRAARSIPALATWGDVERWVARVVYTSALDQLKAQRRRAVRERAAVGREKLSSPHASAELRDELAQLSARVSALSEEDSQALGLRYGRGLTHRASAIASGGTIGALHGRVRRVLAMLRGNKDTGGGS